MRFITLIRLRLRSLLRRQQVERELDDELRFHVEQEIAARVAHGESAENARIAALRLFGSVPRYTDDTRDQRGLHFADVLRQDLKYALRVARRAPAFSAFVVGTLGIAIGANTTIFTVVNAVLIRPLPLVDADRLVLLTSQNPDGSLPRFAVSHADFLDWRAGTRSFTEMAAFQTASMTLAGDEGPERLVGLAVTPTFFAMLQARPLFGRLLDSTDRGSPTVILTHAFWRRIGGDTSIVGHDIRFAGGSRRVAGVLPASFDLGGGPLDAITLFDPSSIPGVENHGQHMLQVAARLRPGVTLEQARQDLAGVAARLAATYPDIKGWRSNVWSWRSEQVRNIRGPLLILLSAAGLLLLIGAINVASLLIARGATRSREVGLREALGAARGRLVSQLLVESVVLAFTGGVLGLMLSVAGTSLLLKLVPVGLIPRVSDVHVDMRVMLFAMAVSMITSLVVGVWPAFRATDPRLASVIQEGGRHGSAGVRASRTRKGLVVVEIALALVMLVGADLLLRSLRNILQVDPGFRPAEMVTMRVSLGPATYPDSAQIRFHEELQRRLSNRPGIEAAAAANVPPIGRGGIVTNVRLLGTGRDPIMSPVTAVTPGYFRTMGIPILRGRDIAWHDPNPVLLASEAAARRLWPGEDPIGKRVAFGARDTLGMEVVGVVGDTRAAGLTSDPLATMYMAYSGAVSITRTMSVVIRGRGGADALAASARTVLHELDPVLPFYNVQSVDQLLNQSIAQPRLNTVLLGAFAGMALLLALTGIYGVIAFSVGQRQREFGVRMALGAQRQEIFRLVLREGVMLAGAGTVCGLAAAYLATSVIQSWLFGVTRGDLVTLGETAALLTAVTLLATYLPARRAASLDPTVALRGE